MTKYQAAFIPAAFLVLALASWPYAYYQLLRIVVTIWALAIAWDQYRHAKSWTAWVVSFVAAAALFNPITPIHFPREIWTILDLAGAAVFGVFAASGRWRRDASGAE